MPEVELIEPQRLNIGGVLYKKGERVPVDFPTAFKFSDNPRFKVYGLNSREAVEFAEREQRPQGDDLNDAIVEAADELDVDNDDNFDRSGKPSLAALSKALGYPITAAERDAALTVGKPKPDAEEIIAAQAKAAKLTSNLKINKPAPAAPVERALDVT